MAGGIGAIVAYLGPNSRSIGTIVPDVVIEEAHRDSLVITQHPVEKGAAITDHAFATPSVVVIRAGFSNSSAGYEGRAQEVYQEFLAWRASRDPRDVSTGKRLYQNMLPADVSIITDGRSENSTIVTVACQEVILTSTQTTGTGTDTTKAGGTTSSQADPATTGSTLNTGPQQGVGTGSQSFAGSFEPGNTNIDGGTVPNGSFGLGGIEAAPAPGSGIAPPAVTTEVGPMTGQDPNTGAIIFDDSNGKNPIFAPAFGGT